MPLAARFKEQAAHLNSSITHKGICSSSLKGELVS